MVNDILPINELKEGKLYRVYGEPLLKKTLVVQWDEVEKTPLQTHWIQDGSVVMIAQIGEAFVKNNVTNTWDMLSSTLTVLEDNSPTHKVPILVIFNNVIGYIFWPNTRFTIA
jgi:hypothetical protein